MLNTNSEFLRAELMDVIRAFGAEDEDITQYFSCAGSKFFNSIEYCGEFFDFEEKYEEADELVFKRLAKRSAKLALYNVLSKFKGGLPWGALTGIRPTKMAYAERAAGRDFKPLFEKLGVIAPNISLIERVLKAQEGIFGKNGQDFYVSLPFCPTKCEYCSFITAPIDKTRVYIDDYINCLIKEIYSVKPFLTDLHSIYIGGGTPFVFDADKLTRIYAAISDVCGANCEYTVEAGRPDVFTEEKVKISADYGVTRLCVNPQTFNDETLKKIGRKHTSAQTLKAFELAQKYGFDINLDLIAGLADETAEDFKNSLLQAISLNPANITVHTLSLKAGSKLKESTKRLNVAGINEMVMISRELLSQAGYEPYYLYRQKYQAGGLENVGWAKKGKACVYNIDVMEEFCDNIAVGANAISKRVYGDEERIERYAAPKDIPSYIIKTDKIIEERGKLFSD